MSRILKLACVSALALASAALSGAAFAQMLAGITVEPSSVVQGGSVKATVAIDVMSGINCGMRLHWGDGSSDNVKVNQKKDVPWVASHSYAKAGKYEIMAEGKTQGMVPGCGGKNQKVALEVTAPPAPAPVAAAAPAAAKAGAVPKATTVAAVAPVNPCPDGWKLAKAGVHKTTKAFTCTAAVNTKLPEQRLTCPGNLDYFENSKKGHLGCKA